MLLLWLGPSWVGLWLSNDESSAKADVWTKAVMGQTSGNYKLNVNISCGIVVNDFKMIDNVVVMTWSELSCRRRQVLWQRNRGSERGRALLAGDTARIVLIGDHWSVQRNRFCPASNVVAPIVILQMIALLELLASSQVRHLRLNGCLREAVLYAHYVLVLEFFLDGENCFCLLGDC